MRLSSRPRHGALLPWLLFAAVALRSLVAPGHEFVNTAGHHGFSLGVAWCPGLNGINLVSGLDENPSDHSHGEESPDGSSGHFTATCGLWTGTTSFVNHNAPLHDDLLHLRSAYQSRNYSSVPSRLSSHRNHPPRAPPVLA